MVHTLLAGGVKKCKRNPKEVNATFSVLSWTPPPQSTEVSSPYHRAQSMGNTCCGCSLEPSRYLPFLGFSSKHRLSGKSCNWRLEWLSLLPEVTAGICLSLADQYRLLWIAMSKGLEGYIFSLGNNLLGRLLFIVELATFLIWIGFFCFSSHGILKKKKQAKESNI